jgi:ferredoxin
MDNAKPVLVIGGGIAGITAAVEAAEAGLSVILVEKSPFLGGRVARFNHYFPKLCPPACGLEINFKRIKNNPRITVLTQAQVEQVSGTPGNFEATLRLEPRYVSAACTACGDCAKACPTGAAKIAQPVPFPALYAIDRPACKADCRACVDACKYGAVNLEQAEERRTYKVAAVVAAIKEYREKDIFTYISQTGERLISGLNELASGMNLKLKFMGYPQMSTFAFGYDDPEVNQDLMTLLLQEMAGRGILLRRGGLVFITYSHTAADIDMTVDAAREVFPILKDALDRGDIKNSLLVEKVSQGIRRF